MAALREADQQVADALDPDAAGAGPGAARPGQLTLAVVDDAQAHDDLLGADRAVADGGEEVVDDS